VTQSKAPAAQWYFGDWRRDTGVQACSFAARGLWIEMLGLMHDGSPRGHLRVGQLSLTTAAQIGRICGGSEPEVAPLLAELEAAGVFSRTEDGTIFSRRMVRETHLSAVRREAGAKGGAVAQAKLRAEAGQSSADAVAEAEGQKEEEVAIPAELDTPGFLAAWDSFRRYRSERHLSPWKPISVRTKLNECAKAGEAASIEAIEHAIGNGWNSFFPLKVAAKSAAAKPRPAALTVSESTLRALRAKDAGHA
jgi:hypothetical protein